MRQIAGDVLEAIGGFANVAASDVCMTRLRIVTEDPALVDTDALADARGVLGFVRRGETGIEVVFGPGKVEAVHDEFQALVAEGMAFLPGTPTEADQDLAAPAEDADDEDETGTAPEPQPTDAADAPEPVSAPEVAPYPADPAPPITVHIIPGAQRNPLRDAALAQLDQGDADDAPDQDETVATPPAPETPDALDELVSLLSTVDEADDGDVITEDDEADLDAGGSDSDADTADASDAPGPAPAPSEPTPAREARLLVINGPNINMLGIREPAIYGRDTYQDLLDLCQSAAAEAGFARCSCFQSNHEGDIVDAIQDAYDTYDGIVINPGAYTHTSVAILDAAKAVALPMVEVHISQVDERESFRQVSYVRAACFETIQGQGIEGYRTAILDLARHIGL